MKQFYLSLLVCFCNLATADEPCNLQSNYIDTRDGGVSISGKFRANLLGSRLEADPTRPEDCSRLVSSTGFTSPHSIVQSSFNTALALTSYTDDVQFSEGDISSLGIAGSLTFKRLTFLTGELDLVAAATGRGGRASNSFLVYGIWRTTDTNDVRTEQLAFPAVSPQDLKIAWSMASNGWTLKVVSGVQIFYVASGQVGNYPVSSAFGALKEANMAAQSSYIKFKSEEVCQDEKGIVPCF